MKAAVYYSNSDIRTEDVDDLSVGPGEIKVRIMFAASAGRMSWNGIESSVREDPEVSEPRA
jgi:hypothetical protein